MYGRQAPLICTQALPAANPHSATHKAFLGHIDSECLWPELARQSLAVLVKRCARGHALRGRRARLLSDDMPAQRRVL